MERVGERDGRKLMRFEIFGVIHYEDPPLAPLVTCPRCGQRDRYATRSWSFRHSTTCSLNRKRRRRRR